MITRRPYTGKLDDLSEQPVKEIIRKVLVNDAKKAIDTEAHDQFKAAPLRVAATATAAITLTTNGTATVTNSIALGTSHVKLIVDEMKERNIPAYMSDDYYSLAWPSTYRTFKDNLESTVDMKVQGSLNKPILLKEPDLLRIPPGPTPNLIGHFLWERTL